MPNGKAALHLQKRDSRSLMSFKLLYLFIALLLLLWKLKQQHTEAPGPAPSLSRFMQHFFSFFFFFLGPRNDFAVVSTAAETGKRVESFVWEKNSLILTVGPRFPCSPGFPCATDM